MKKKKKHKSKDEKRKKKRKKSPEVNQTTPPPSEEAAEEQEVERPAQSTVVREEWMTKPKEGWLSGGQRPGRHQPEAPATPKEPRPEAGLYVPSGSATRVAENKCVVGDGGASWRLKALKRMKERSQMEDKSLEELAAERGVDLERLQREAAQPSASRSRNRFHRPKRHSYLDDIHSERGRMKKPQTDRLSFTKRRDSSQATETNKKDVPSNVSSTAVNKFPSDGSFLSMFSGNDQTSHSGAKKELKDEGRGSLHGQGNASIAEQLRQQLLSGKSLQPKTQSHQKTETGSAAPPLRSDAFGVSSKKRRDLDDDDDDPDVATLYKRAKSGGDAADMDAALANNISRRQRFDVREDLSADMEYDFGVGTDLFDKKKKKNRKMTLSDLQRRDRQKQAKAAERTQALEDRCPYCFNGTRIPKHLVVSIGTLSYLRLPEKGALDPKHCYIVPLEHLPSTRELDDDAWTEIRNFKKALIQMNAAQGRDVIFLETSMHVKSHERHAFVECVPVDRAVAQKAPMYFKKAIDDATSDWSQHHSKRCIETGTKGLRGSIPEHFPYFHVEFNLSNGFVHVIDDESNFDPNLGRRVLIGLLNRPAEEMYKREERKSVEEHKESMKSFLKDWHPFDWTVNL